MKKLFILPLILVLTNVHAQSLVKLGVTYTIGKEQSYLGKKKDLLKETNVNSSFGGGFTVDVGYVYLNNNNFGPEATFSFFVSKPKTIEHIVDNQNETETIIKSKLLFFSPSLYIIGNSTTNLSPYLSSGLLFNLWENVTKKVYTTNQKSDKTEKTYKINFNRGIGYKSKIGMIYSENTNLLLFTEIQYQMFSIGYKNEIVQSYTVNQVDSLSDLSASEKKINYHLELNKSSNNPFSINFDQNKATDVGLTYANYNHFGISTGLFFKGN
ncbi:MAG: hypothetical protein K0B10_12880 [Vicingaceae bacterium]|nr:hypothetical protein [Vicingaceae bacterium]